MPDILFSDTYSLQSNNLPFSTPHYLQNLCLRAPTSIVSEKDTHDHIAQGLSDWSLSHGLLKHVRCSLHASGREAPLTAKDWQCDVAVEMMRNVLYGGMKTSLSAELDGRYMSRCGSSWESSHQSTLVKGRSMQ